MEALNIDALGVINRGFRLVACVNGRAYLRSSGRNRSTPMGEWYPIAGALPTWIVKAEKGKSAVDLIDIEVCKQLTEAAGGTEWFNVMGELRLLILHRKHNPGVDSPTFEVDGPTWHEPFNAWLAAHGCMGRRSFEAWQRRGIERYWPFDTPNLSG